jgi:uncharacterized protein YcbK (DUF882 family)
LRDACHSTQSGWTAALLALFAIGALEPTARADAPGPEPAHASAPAKKKRKRHAKVPVFSGRLASSAEMRDDPLPHPSGHISLYAVNFQESLDVDLYNEDGSFNEEALDQLNHLWRCKRTDTEKAIDPHLFEQLSRIYDHFGRRIELVSGFRNQQRTSSFHFHGSASDIRIPGVSDRELHKFVGSLDAGGMGLGLYPRAGFIHVDVRPEPSYRWVDYSPPGSGDMGRPHHKKTHRPQPNS